jgi:WhiB family redox-sensing transcriptional regulator
VTSTIERLGWMDAAVCLQVGPDPFFTEDDSQGGADPVEAKALCRSCESRAACLSWALERGIRDGVFGGFTDRPRRRIDREHRAGKPLEDIIAEDDAEFYARLEAEQAQAASLKEARLARRRIQDRARTAAAKEVAA